MLRREISMSSVMAGEWRVCGCENLQAYGDGRRKFRWCVQKRTRSAGASGQVRNVVDDGMLVALAPVDFTCTQRCYTRLHPVTSSTMRIIQRRCLACICSHAERS